MARKGKKHCSGSLGGSGTGTPRRRAASPTPGYMKEGEKSTAAAAEKTDPVSSSALASSATLTTPRKRTLQTRRRFISTPAPSQSPSPSAFPSSAAKVGGADPSTGGASAAATEVSGSPRRYSPRNHSPSRLMSSSAARAEKSTEGEASTGVEDVTAKPTTAVISIDVGLGFGGEDPAVATDALVRVRESRQTAPRRSVYAAAAPRSPSSPASTPPSLSSSLPPPPSESPTGTGRRRRRQNADIYPPPDPPVAVAVAAGSSRASPASPGSDRAHTVESSSVSTEGIERPVVATPTATLPAPTQKPTPIPNGAWSATGGCRRSPNPILRLYAGDVTESTARTEGAAASLEDRARGRSVSESHPSLSLSPIDGKEGGDREDQGGGQSLLSLSLWGNSSSSSSTKEEEKDNGANADVAAAETSGGDAVQDDNLTTPALVSATAATLVTPRCSETVARRGVVDPLNGRGSVAVSAIAVVRRGVARGPGCAVSKIVAAREEGPPRAVGGYDATPRRPPIAGPVLSNVHRSHGLPTASGLGDTDRIVGIGGDIEGDAKEGREPKRRRGVRDDVVGTVSSSDNSDSDDEDNSEDGNEDGYDIAIGRRGARRSWRRGLGSTPGPKSLRQSRGRSGSKVLGKGNGARDGIGTNEAEIINSPIAATPPSTWKKGRGRPPKSEWCLHGGCTKRGTEEGRLCPAHFAKERLEEAKEVTAGRPALMSLDKTGGQKEGLEGVDEEVPCELETLSAVSSTGDPSSDEAEEEPALAKETLAAAAASGTPNQNRRRRAYSRPSRLIGERRRLAGMLRETGEDAEGSEAMEAATILAETASREAGEIFPAKEGAAFAVTTEAASASMLGVKRRAGRPPPEMRCAAGGCKRWGVEVGRLCPRHFALRQDGERQNMGLSRGEEESLEGEEDKLLATREVGTYRGTGLETAKVTVTVLVTPKACPTTALTPRKITGGSDPKRRSQRTPKPNRRYTQEDAPLLSSSSSRRPAASAAATQLTARAVAALPSPGSTPTRSSAVMEGVPFSSASPRKGKVPRGTPKQRLLPLEATAIVTAAAARSDDGIRAETAGAMKDRADAKETMEDRPDAKKAEIGAEAVMKTGTEIGAMDRVQEGKAGVVVEEPIVDAAGKSDDGGDNKFVGRGSTGLAAFAVAADHGNAPKPKFQSVCNRQPLSGAARAAERVIDLPVAAGSSGVRTATDATAGRGREEAPIAGVPVRDDDNAATGAACKGRATPTGQGHGPCHSNAAKKAKCGVDKVESDAKGWFNLEVDGERVVVGAEDDDSVGREGFVATDSTDINVDINVAVLETEAVVDRGGPAAGVDDSLIAAAGDLVGPLALATWAIAREEVSRTVVPTQDNTVAGFADMMEPVPSYRRPLEDDDVDPSTGGGELSPRVNAAANVDVDSVSISNQLTPLSAREPAMTGIAPPFESTTEGVAGATDEVRLDIEVPASTGFKPSAEDGMEERRFCELGKPTSKVEDCTVAPDSAWSSDDLMKIRRLGGSLVKMVVNESTQTTAAEVVTAPMNRRRLESANVANFNQDFLEKDGKGNDENKRLSSPFVLNAEVLSRRSPIRGAPGPQSSASNLELSALPRVAAVPKTGSGSNVVSLRLVGSRLVVDCLSLDAATAGAALHRARARSRSDSAADFSRVLLGGGSEGSRSPSVTGSTRCLSPPPQDSSNRGRKEDIPAMAAKASASIPNTRDGSLSDDNAVVRGSAASMTILLPEDVEVEKEEEEKAQPPLPSSQGAEAVTVGPVMTPSSSLATLKVDNRGDVMPVAVADYIGRPSLYEAAQATSRTSLSPSLSAWLPDEADSIVEVPLRERLGDGEKGTIAATGMGSGTGTEKYPLELIEAECTKGRCTAKVKVAGASAQRDEVAIAESRLTGPVSAAATAEILLGDGRSEKFSLSVQTLALYSEEGNAAPPTAGWGPLDASEPEVSLDKDWGERKVILAAGPKSGTSKHRGGGRKATAEPMKATSDSGGPLRALYDIGVHRVVGATDNVSMNARATAELLSGSAVVPSVSMPASSNASIATAAPLPLKQLTCTSPGIIGDRERVGDWERRRSVIGRANEVLERRAGAKTATTGLSLLTGVTERKNSALRLNGSIAVDSSKAWRNGEIVEKMGTSMTESPSIEDVTEFSKVVEKRGTRATVESCMTSTYAVSDGKETTSEWDSAAKGRGGLNDDKKGDQKNEQKQVVTKVTCPSNQIYRFSPGHSNAETDRVSSNEEEHSTALETQKRKFETTLAEEEKDKHIGWEMLKWKEEGVLLQMGDKPSLTMRKRKISETEYITDTSGNESKGMDKSDDEVGGAFGRQIESLHERIEDVKRPKKSSSQRSKRGRDKLLPSQDNQNLKRLKRIRPELRRCLEQRSSEMMPWLYETSRKMKRFPKYRSILPPPILPLAVLEQGNKRQFCTERPLNENIHFSVKSKYNSSIIYRAAQARIAAEKYQEAEQLCEDALHDWYLYAHNLLECISTSSCVRDVNITEVEEMSQSLGSLWCIYARVLLEMGSSEINLNDKSDISESSTDGKITSTHKIDSVKGKDGDSIGGVRSHRIESALKVLKKAINCQLASTCCWPWLAYSRLLIRKAGVAAACHALLKTKEKKNCIGSQDLQGTILRDEFCLSYREAIKICKQGIQALTLRKENAPYHNLPQGNDDFGGIHSWSHRDITNKPNSDLNLDLSVCTHNYKMNLLQAKLHHISKKHPLSINECGLKMLWAEMSRMKEDEHETRQYCALQQNHNSGKVIETSILPKKDNRVESYPSSVPLEKVISICTISLEKQAQGTSTEGDSLSQSPRLYSLLDTEVCQNSEDKSCDQLSKREMRAMNLLKENRPQKKELIQGLDHLKEDEGLCCDIISPCTELSQARFGVDLIRRVTASSKIPTKDDKREIEEIEPAMDGSSPPPSRFTALIAECSSGNNLNRRSSVCGPFECTYQSRTSSIEFNAHYASPAIGAVRQCVHGNGDLPSARAETHSAKI